MREELVLSNVGLIYQVLKKYKLYNLRDEYFDAGMVGLVKAANTFDSTKGYKFSTYAFKCISSEILTCLRKDNYRMNDISFDYTICDDLKLEDLLQDPFDMDEHLYEKEEINRLYEEIEKLNAIEKICIVFSYGLYGAEKMKQKDIANVLGMTQASVSRTISRTIKKLRKRLQ